MRLAALLLLSFAVPATAEDFSLSRPIDCDLDGPCFIQQYVDHDAGPDASDFACSGLSYDGHKGTDFALPTYDMIGQGVDVLAAANGTVRGLRDGMDDARYSPERAAQIEGKECGNGVVVQHDDGWETQYCHMRRGSIAVVKGQQVKAGDVLGQVGMSGRAEFPHLHLSVRKDGAVIDPFDPDGAIACGEIEEDTLWSQDPLYRPGGIISIGAASGVPEFSAIRANTVPLPTPTSDALAIYAFLFGTRAGDVLRLSLTGPEDTSFERDIKLKRTQAQSFRAFGKKRRAARWPEGEYEGVATLIRDNEVVEEQTLTLTMP